MLCSAGRVLSCAPEGPSTLDAGSEPLLPLPRPELVASLESSRRQAEFPFSFPSFFYFGAVPRGKTHLTHEAFPEPARPLSGLLVGVRGQGK